MRFRMSHFCLGVNKMTWRELRPEEASAAYTLCTDLFFDIYSETFQEDIETNVTAELQTCLFLTNLCSAVGDHNKQWIYKSPISLGCFLLVPPVKWADWRMRLDILTCQNANFLWKSDLRRQASRHDLRPKTWYLGCSSSRPEGAADSVFICLELPDLIL